MTFTEWFTRFAKRTSQITGRPATFLLAVAVILVWAVTGPIFHFNDTWQLVINTGTTIVTFLMVFLIQNTQNRDATAMQIKLDELIRAVKGAHNTIVSLEELGERDLERVKAVYDRLAERARMEGEPLDAEEAAEEIPELRDAIHDHGAVTATKTVVTVTKPGKNRRADGGDADAKSA